MTVDEIIKQYYENACDRSSGYNISDYDGRNYIRDCLTRVKKHLEDNPLEESDWTKISCGNLCVMVLGSKVGPGQYEYEIMVSRSWKEDTIYMEDTNYPFRV